MTKRYVAVSAIILAAAFLITAAAIGAAQYFAAREAIENAVGAVYAKSPEAAELMLDAIVTGERGDGRLAAGSLGRTERAFGYAVDRLLPRGIWLLILAPAAVSAIAALYLIRRAERRGERIRRDLSSGKPIARDYPEEQMLARLASEAERQREVSRLRDAENRRYVENVAHEIKTPAAGLMLTLDLIETEGATRARLTRARDSAGKIQFYVQELLTLARMRAGKLRLSPERCDLDEIARSAAEAAPGAEYISDAGCEIIGDPNRLYEAIRNLAANAVRHSETGKATVQLTESDDRAVIRVTNPGTLPAEWERYAVGSEDGTSTGIGLSIAREIALRHHGSLSMRGSGGEVTAELSLSKEKLKDKLSL